MPQLVPLSFTGIAILSLEDLMYLQDCISHLDREISICQGQFDVEHDLSSLRDMLAHDISRSKIINYIKKNEVYTWVKVDIPQL